VFLGRTRWPTQPDAKENENASIMTGKQANGVRNLNTGRKSLPWDNPAIAHQGFQNAIILSGASPALIETNDSTLDQQITLEQLREARFGSFERLLASYVFFLALAKAGCVFPCSISY